jgi:hypothetical protein
MTGSSPRVGGLEPYGLVPRSVIRGALGGDRFDDSRLVHLYAELDLRRGATGRPGGGYRDLAKALGWQPRTVERYARHLADLGLVEINSDGRGAVAIDVVHNPSRKDRRNPDSTVADAGSRVFPRAGTRAGHQRRPPPDVANGAALGAPTAARADRAQRGSTRSVARALDAREVARGTRASGPNPDALDAPGVGHSGDRWCSPKPGREPHPASRCSLCVSCGETATLDMGGSWWCASCAPFTDDESWKGQQA